MELPQPRPFGTEGRKRTHDFLSLCSHSTAQQDPTQSFQGGYLETHDFLRPLERIGKSFAKEETTIDVSNAEPPPPPLVRRAHNSSIEHLLPGGIGTYTISHISYFDQRVAKPEGPVFSVAQASNSDRNDEHSRSSSLSGSGFALWEESAVKKGKTRKENLAEKPGLRVADYAPSRSSISLILLEEKPAKIGPFSTERPSQSSSSNHRNSYSSLSSSQPSCQKNQSFAEILKSALTVSSKEEELDDREVFVVKKEPSSTSHKGELRINVGGKCSDQKANTPRSKHSATEQRRRSKINDRFLKLRELIPRSDQKRDKASLLLEVVEYIKFLQQKVHKYEGSHQGLYREPAKLIPSRKNCNLEECCIDQSRGIHSDPASILFGTKSDEKNMPGSPAFPGCSQNPVESEISTATTFKEADHHRVTNNKPTPHPTQQPHHSIPGINADATVKLHPRLAHDVDQKPCQVQPATCEPMPCATKKTIEGGRISISSAYSQGLLKSLTKALQSSGLDMSQARISVQIELGNRPNSRETVRTRDIMEVAICPSDGGIAATEDARISKKKQKII